MKTSKKIQRNSGRLAAFAETILLGEVNVMGGVSILTIGQIAAIPRLDFPDAFNVDRLTPRIVLIGEICRFGPKNGKFLPLSN